MSLPMNEAPAAALDTYKVPRVPLYLVGMYDKGVTVYNQQIRALNLVWSLMETRKLKAIDETSTSVPTRVAIIGAGFAGMTAAAGLIEKRANASITIFEQRDTLLPLQHGSDSRWLHPRIYDWPADGSESPAAMLPVLNWTAARASDVVVQVLTEWSDLVSKIDGNGPSLDLYCNARHLQIHQVDGRRNKIQIEWVGERRRPEDGSVPEETSHYSKVGKSETFDVVILATGFGLERDKALSYWRNDFIAQPSLEQPRRTYLLSGGGDGAMIDLLRLRVSQYRQDRILDELFDSDDEVVGVAYEIYNSTQKSDAVNLFRAFEDKLANSDIAEKFNSVLQKLNRRLRRDTDVILHLNSANFYELFDPKNSRISFQNRFLVYLLYKCGGFTPSFDDERELIVQYGIDENCVIRRHGSQPAKALQGMLSSSLHDKIESEVTRSPNPFIQTESIMWPGGYFGYPGSSDHSSEISNDKMRKSWRKEYLPGSTNLIATAFCSSLSGIMMELHGRQNRLRVTLHRSVVFGRDELLQQCCNYFGFPENTVDRSQTVVGRTFPARNATIGLAYRTHKIIRSRKSVDPELLVSAMSELNLNQASSKMSEDVRFLLAIPILEPADNYTAPSPVAAVLYIDSTKPDFYLADQDVKVIANAFDEFVKSMMSVDKTRSNRIRNFNLNPLASLPIPPSNLTEEPEIVRSCIEFSGVDAPSTNAPFQFNYDYSDFIPVDPQSSR